MGRISIDEIKNIPYDGYLWWSDQEDPKVCEQQPVSLPREGDHPFVVEGQLYNRAEGLSYSIRYADGRHIVQEHGVAEADLRCVDHQRMVYESNRMGDRRLVFLRYWEEVADEDGFAVLGGAGDTPQGLPVLTQTKNVFVGFETRREA